MQTPLKKCICLWCTVIRWGQVVPAMKVMVPAKAILNKNPANVTALLSKAQGIS